MRTRRLSAAFLAILLVVLTVGGPPASAARSRSHEVGYDRYSLTIDGRRVVVQAAEFHYFRLPSPGLWRDVLEKFKAAGFNAVSLYFDWAYHSPKPGVYDFTGVRDIDRLLGEAERAGLYVIARPGPYINAETTGGGFPAWLKTVEGRGRSSDPGYTAAYQDWLGHIDPIIARHQITRGGSVIVYQAENEYAVNTDRQYMADIQSKARADGIDVPISHNQCCDNASWTTDWSTGLGAVQLPGVDDYPQSFDCANPATTWGPWGEGVTERASQGSPVFAAEYQAGAIDTFNAGYEGCRELTGPGYMRFFHKNNLITSGATMFSYYMGYGGTNWGWLAQPNDAYTSYDYGAAITETRQLTDKYDEFKRQGYFLRAVTPIAQTDPVPGPASDNPAVTTVARANPGTGTQFVLVRHTDRAAGSTDSATLAWTTPDGGYSVPVQVGGREAKVLVAGYDLGGQRLVYSTSEIMTHLATGGRDIAVLYGSEGSAGRTVLRYSAAPVVKVLDGAVTSAYASGDLTLSYAHTGLARVLISGGGRRPLLLLLGTEARVATFWQAGSVLVRGTSLLRSADVRGDTVSLRADSARAGDVEVFGAARDLVVNGEKVATTSTPSGSLLGSLPGPRPVRLPALTRWRTKAEAPEVRPGFDDSAWTVADHTTTAIPYLPKTQPVLFAEEYGFDYGNVWYRGRFTATGTETQVALNAITGRRGTYLAWLNGHYLGSAAGGTQADSDTRNPDPGPGNFAIPAGLLKPGEQAVLAVLVQNMGHNDDWTADDSRFKQPRGLFGAALGGSSAAISWKIQGARGGRDLVDPVRGPLNTGGLYGERSGWQLPGYRDGSWQETSTPSAQTPGVWWYRTTFGLNLPGDQDTPIALRFGGQLPAGARVLVFLNGWNVGQYSGDIGPQRDFSLPEGILDHQGDNTLALAVTTATGTDLGPVSLVAAGNVRGGAH